MDVMKEQDRRLARAAFVVIGLLLLIMLPMVWSLFRP